MECECQVGIGQQNRFDVLLFHHLAIRRAECLQLFLGALRGRGNSDVRVMYRIEASGWSRHRPDVIERARRVRFHDPACAEKVQRASDRHRALRWQQS